MARPTWKQTAAVAALAGGAALGTAGCSGAGPPSPLPTSGSLPAPPNHNRTVQNLRLGQMPPSIRHFMQRFKGIQIFGTTDGPHEAVGVGIGRVGHKFTIAGFVISTEHDPDIQAVLN